MKKSLIALAVSALFATVPTMAAEPSVPAQIYIGAGGGIADTDSHHASFKAFAGVQASQYVGIEAAYNNFGHYRGDTADSWSVAMTGTIPVYEKWDVFAKLGMTQNITHYDGASHRNDLLAGVGIGYNASKNASIRLEYEDFGKLPDAPDGSHTRVANLGLSLKYTF